MGGDVEARRTFLQSALDALPSVAVVQLLDAAAEASGASISKSLTMLLTKLARHADDADAERSKEGSSHLSEEMDRMLQGWQLENPNPEQYDRVLKDLSQFTSGAGHDLAGPAVSVVQMAIEVDQYGDTVEKSLLDLVEAGELQRVAPVILEAQGAAAQSMRERLADPGLIGDLSGMADVDAGSLGLLTSFLDPPIAASCLLDLIMGTDSAAVRATAATQLLDVADHLGERVMELLVSEYADMVLVGLEVVGRTGRAPADFSPLEMLHHRNEEVRRIALRHALRLDETRAAALDAALRSDDQHLQGTALELMADDPPDHVLPTVVEQVLAKPDAPAWLARLAIHVLSRSGSDVARKGLLDFVVVGRTLFGRPKLAAPERSVLEAIEGLGRHSTHEDVAALLKQARRSKDERVRRAAGRRSR